MNTRSSRPQLANDFATNSSALARARAAAPAAVTASAHASAPASAHETVRPARQSKQSNEDYAQGLSNSQFESSLSSDSRIDERRDERRDERIDERRDDEEEAVALALAPLSEAASQSFDLIEESEINESELNDLDAREIEDPRFVRQGDERDERAEDYAEFERVFRQWKATGDPRLRERLILMNRSMVMFLARRFMDRGELFEDVLQVGMLGLIYALDGYDMDRGVKFSTFAIPTISGEIRRYFRDKVSGMRVPRGLQELHSKLQIRIEELTQQLDRSPTYAEIAFSLKIEVEQVVEAMELGSAVDPLSIDDRFYGEESATIAESVGAPDPQLHAYEEHAALQAALEKLPAQERRVLEMNFFEGHSQAEIARRLNVSQMHISRLLRRSLSQLKELLEEA